MFGFRGHASLTRIFHDNSLILDWPGGAITWSSEMWDLASAAPIKNTGAKFQLALLRLAYHERSLEIQNELTKMSDRTGQILEIVSVCPRAVVTNTSN